ncbi:MAG TPA: MTH938/NDUFAF3 family protein [Hyphomicrobiaceae bacterium]|nr:MTH938/NDUFAF3 family protein [Hyphomicrobiaceae bacterium]
MNSDGQAAAAGSGRYPGQAPIDAYGNGGFRFAGMSHRGAILCLPSAILVWRPSAVDDIGEPDLAAVLAEPRAVKHLLIGTGLRFALPPRAILRRLADAGIGAEPMDTGAACRTYNILLSERRPVAAALLPVA